MDRISDLPDLLIEKILLFMPLRDAVRISVLSTNWQYRWTTIPKLVIDMSFASAVAKKVRKEPSEYLHIINSLLLQHTGSLEEFGVFFPNLYSNGYNVDQSIRTVLLKGIKKLTITGSFITSPSSFPPVSSLTSLDLGYYVFTEYPCLRGFPNLKSLTFRKVVGDLDSLTTFISNCPNLQRVALKIPAYNGQIVNICAPKLEYFFVKGMFKSLCLQGAHKVRVMQLYLKRMYECPLWNAVDFFGCLVGLESLRLGGGSIYKVLALNGHWQKLPKGFGKLTSLKLAGVEFADADVLRCILCFIRSSLNLRRLEISANFPIFSVPKELNLQAQGYECCTLAHLEKIYIGPIFGANNELEVIEFLLSCTPALQVMSIWHKEVPFKRIAKATVYKKLTGLPCASPTAQVLISDEYRAPLF